MGWEQYRDRRRFFRPGPVTVPGGFSDPVGMRCFGGFKLFSESSITISSWLSFEGQDLVILVKFKSNEWTLLSC